MAITYEGDRARFSGAVTVEEAEDLLAWLCMAQPPRSQPRELDLSACTHCHAAVLQLLMAARPAIAAPPADAGLAAWLDAACPA